MGLAWVRRLEPSLGAGEVRGSVPCLVQPWERPARVQRKGNKFQFLGEPYSNSGCNSPSRFLEDRAELWACGTRQGDFRPPFEFGLYSITNRP